MKDELDQQQYSSLDTIEQQLNKNRNIQQMSEEVEKEYKLIEYLLTIGFKGKKHIYQLF